MSPFDIATRVVRILPAESAHRATIDGLKTGLAKPTAQLDDPRLAVTLRKLVEAERLALKAGKSRKEAIYAAYDRFYTGDIASEIVRGVREEGGLFTTEDLANWKVKIEEPVTTNYRGIDVYKLQQWTQGPALLQALIERNWL